MSPLGAEVSNLQAADSSELQPRRRAVRSRMPPTAPKIALLGRPEADQSRHSCPALVRSTGFCSDCRCAQARCQRQTHCKESEGIPEVVSQVEESYAAGVCK